MGLLTGILQPQSIEFDDVEFHGDGIKLNTGAWCGGLLPGVCNKTDTWVARAHVDTVTYGRSFPKLLFVLAALFLLVGFVLRQESGSFQILSGPSRSEAALVCLIIGVVLTAMVMYTFCLRSLHISTNSNHYHSEQYCCCYDSNRAEAFANWLTQKMNRGQGSGDSPQSIVSTTDGFGPAPTRKHM